MQWKYWDAWPGWGRPRSFVLAKQGEIIAHTGIVLLRFALGDRVHTLAQPMDWAADPGHVGGGAVLLQRLGGLVDGLVSLRGSIMTQRILAPMGFRPFGESTRFAAPVLRDPSRSEALPRGTLRVHTRTEFDPREHPLADAGSDPHRIVLRRNRAEVRRWLECPTAPMRYVEVFAAEDRIGSFLLCEAPGQVRIVDAWASDRVDGAHERVMALACEHASDLRGAGEVVCQTNDPAQIDALQGVGFVAVGTDPLWIRADPSLVPDGAFVRHQLLDSDLAYLHHGEPLRWLD
jgi:hypothetical protein